MPFFKNINPTHFLELHGATFVRFWSSNMYVETYKAKIKRSRDFSVPNYKYMF